jgi:Mn-dependent DtxR family transcriptional regulator
VTTPYYYKTIESLAERGLIERDGDKVVVTPAGDEWTRALIAQYPNIKKARKCKTRSATKSA